MNQPAHTKRPFKQPTENIDKDYKDYIDKHLDTLNAKIDVLQSKLESL